MRALVLGGEDGDRTKIGLALRLRWPDAELATAEAAHGAPRVLTDDPPDVLLVSATVADSDTPALVRGIRQVSDIAVVVVGSGGREMDAVEALEAGADDYLSTPISESLLVARVCAVLRRSRKVVPEAEPTVKCGDLVIEPGNHEARIDGKPLCLTPTEFKLLYQLARHFGRVVTQQALQHAIWGGSDSLYIDVLRKHVQRLRRKLELPRRGSLTIATVPRVGYRLA